MIGAAILLATLQTRATVGEFAPDFRLVDQNQRVHRLSDYRGKTVAIMFFPKDFTPSCTAQVRDVGSVFKGVSEKGSVVVLAINSDTVETRRRFAAATGAQFPLLSDPNGTVIRSYGVMGENGLPRRVTVIVGPDGRVQAIDGAVDSTIEGNGPHRKSTYAGELELMLSDWGARLGSRIPRLFVPNASGDAVATRMGGERASLLLVVGDECPTSGSAMEWFEATEAKLRKASVTMSMLVVSNAGNQRPRRVTEHPAAGYDAGNHIARRLRATHTPMAYLTDGKGSLAYMGDWRGVASAPRPVAEELISLVLAGRPVPPISSVPAGTQVALGSGD